MGNSLSAVVGLRLISALVWAVPVLLGFCAVLQREQSHKLQSLALNPIAADCPYAALRDMPAGFRLFDTDWQGPADKKLSISGRYTAKDFTRGRRICRSDLVATAYADPKDGHAAMLVKWPTDGLNRGATVDVWQEQKVIAKNARILAIVCPKECSQVMIELPEGDVSKVDPAKVQLTIRKLP